MKFFANLLPHSASALALSLASISLMPILLSSSQGADSDKSFQPQSLAQSESKLVVYVNPAMIPDTGICHLFSDRISRLDFLFYYEGEESKPIANLDQSMFTLDLPEGLNLRSVALWAGWGVFGGKHHQFRTEKVERDGARYTRYFIPLPGKSALARAVPVKGTGYSGKSNHQCKLFVEPSGAPLAKEFHAYWKIAKVEGGPAQAEGSFPVKLFALEKESPKPKRIFLLALAGQIRPPWSDLAEIESTITLFKDLGISYVPFVNRTSMVEQNMPDLWTQAGFKFTTLLYEPMPKGKEREELPEMRDYLVGLDGERAKGHPAEKYHQRIYCPLSLNTPGRSGFEFLKERALQAANAGTEIIDWDLEPQTWTECFCGDCRKEFARVSKMSEEAVDKLKPIEFILLYPQKWYNFRNDQTATFYRNMRKAVQAVVPKAKISANSLLVAADKNLGRLGPGLCTFAEDPRLLDSAVDIFTIDTLTGSAGDPVFLDVVRQGTTKPLIATAGCAYSIAYNHNYIAGRRMRADKEGLTLGYDRRGDLQRLGMVSLAATGAVGIRIPILMYNEVVDAEVAMETVKAAAHLAKLEDRYLDWKRSDEGLVVFDLTQEASPWLRDRSIIMGGPWKSYYDRFGGKVQFRVHTQGGEETISLFNWDPYQDKQWLVRLKEPSQEGLFVYDLLSGTPYALEENAGEHEPLAWTKEQLQKGITVQVPSAGYIVLAVAKRLPKNAPTPMLLSKSSRESGLKQAEKLTPVTFDSWRSGEEIDLRKEALYRIERTRRYLPEGTVPQS